MGWSVWVMICQDGKWTRKSWAWYERFCAGRERVEGTELRVAQVPVELEDREPVGVRQPWFVLHGLVDGRIDMEREDQVNQASMESVPFPIKVSGESVVDAGHKFARQRVRDRLGRWEPTREEVEGFHQLLRQLDVPL